ncbi:hypothetical protein SARC_06955 [Sphaeroforma arctica JP610]|uniref:Uncharacterized protein n=1 Tax=Sphaeroforma arctica JP610 TaxID=667725 RepID=A0A0L0FVW9_9EUKA|nr:hypothetical protein SARC_06955 [Sphaeroforma arctica JP610]KNC80706.1 hypothetical protein SARC_06955 [Sphaeroforma arctica JP610]|eukprot:XP_014154608.1 hypothetical protein SARC_06955 [Sphaeroforma arctica JP610]
MGIVEIFTIPDSYSSLEETHEFAVRNWPGCPRYATLNQANKSLHSIHNLCQEFGYNPIGISVSTGRLLAHLSCSRATIALIRARADANEDEARELIDEEYALNQKRDARVQTKRKLDVLNVRYSSTKEKLARCEAELNNTRAQLHEAEIYIGTYKKPNLRAAELQGEVHGLRAALSEAQRPQ